MTWPWRRCTGPGTHRFEARYDTPAAVAIVEAAVQGGYNIGSMDATSLAHDRRYICDVCRWCGAVVQRPQTPETTKQEAVNAR